MTEPANPAAPVDLKTGIRAIKTLLRYAHLTVEEGQEKDSKPLQCLLEGMAGKVLKLSMPMDGPLQLRPDFGPGADDLGALHLPDCRERYSDFPEVQDALNVAERMLGDAENWKKRLEKHFDPQSYFNLQLAFHDAVQGGDPQIVVLHSKYAEILKREFGAVGGFIDASASPEAAVNEIHKIRFNVPGMKR